MNISDIVGPVDIFSAAVVIGLGAGVTIVVTTLITRTSGKKLEMDFELAKMQQIAATDSNKQQNAFDREKALAQMALTKEIEFKRIENGMLDVKAVRNDGE